MTTKTEVLKLATQQSQAAQAVTANMRSHGWRRHWDGMTPVPTDDEWRREQGSRERCARRCEPSRARSERGGRVMALCRWCKRERDLTTGKLCSRCRAKADRGGGPPKHDAMSRRLPGHFEATR